MSTGTATLVVLLVAAMTYAMRASAILLLADRRLPVPVERALRNVGPAVLAALAVNLAFGGDEGGAIAVAEVAALVGAGLVALWTKSVIWTLVAGMSILWILTALLP